MTEKIKSAVASLDLIHEKSPLNGKITVSMGLSVLIPQAEMEMRVLVAQADTALYQAKREGRDRIIAYEVEPI